MSIKKFDKDPMGRVGRLAQHGRKYDIKDMPKTRHKKITPDFIQKLNRIGDTPIKK